MHTSRRFTVAVHILALLALYQQRYGKDSLTSRTIAGSVNTNPVVIRRALGLLARAGLVTTHQGAEGGASLAQRPEDIRLLDVYRVTVDGPLFPLHSNAPSSLCPCGRHIQPVLLTQFGEVEAALEAALAGRTVADVVVGLDLRLNQENAE
jgi:DNA-binding IscR family transcriptional regulator